MTNAIVKVPSTWMVFLPGNRWVNLAQICDAEFLDGSNQLVVTWASGEATTFEGDQALVLAQSLEESRLSIDQRISQILIP